MKGGDYLLSGLGETNRTIEPEETYIICLFDESPIAHRAIGSRWAADGQLTGSPWAALS